MNWDQIQGNWKQLKGKAHQAWGDMTDDEWAKIDGRREELSGVLQTKYGTAKDAADKQVDDWMSKL